MYSKHNKTFYSHMDSIGGNLEKLWFKTKQILYDLSENNRQNHFTNYDRSSRNVKLAKPKPQKKQNDPISNLKQCIKSLKAELASSFNIQTQTELNDHYQDTIHKTKHYRINHYAPYLIMDRQRNLYFGNGIRMKQFLDNGIEAEHDTILKQGLIEDRDSIDENSDIYMYNHVTGQIKHMPINIYRIELTKSIAALCKIAKNPARA